MSDESKKILLTDEYKSPLKLVESYSTPSGPHTGAVLATLFGTLSDYSEETRNQRWYTGSLWRKVLNDPLLKEALDNKVLMGESDHPLDIENRLETHIPYVSHIIRDPKINEGKQCVEGYLDILDTPNGRIIKTLLDYGSTMGVSSRGSGDLTYQDGKTLVDENTYTFITWDIVARPSNRKARVHEIDTVNDEGKTAFESMKSQINTMINNGDKQMLKLTESLISNTDIPDKDNLIKMINESIDSEMASEPLSSEDDKDLVPKSDLDEAYDKILNLKSENSELDSENKDLKESLKESENTISELNALNKNLSSMVTSYMEQLSETDKKEDDHTIESESTVEDKKLEYSEVESEPEVDFSEVLDAIDKSNNQVMTKLSEMVRKLNQSVKTNDLQKVCEELKDQLSDAEEESTELKVKLKNSQNENVRLIKKTSSIINEYFRLRCSNLGLNEQLAKKEFNNRLYEYDLKDIDEVLNEMYSSNRNIDESQRVLNETMNSGKLGSLQLTGTVKSRTSDDSTSSNNEDDEEMDALVESIKAVKLN